MRKWFEMKAVGESAAEIAIYGSIGMSWWDDDAVTAKQFADDLKALGDVKSIALRINSPGGDVFDGVTIHNLLAQHPAKVTAHVDGLAASAASYIAMAADEIVMPENAFMLVHEASAVAIGDAATMLAMASDLERINVVMAQGYADRVGAKVEDVRALMSEDRLMDAAEAKSLGYADTIGERVKMAASYSLRELPEAARAKIEAMMRADAGDPPVEADPAPADNSAPPATAGDIPEGETPPPTSSNVVDFEAARQAARVDGEQAGYAHAAEIADLCAMAGFPQMASGFIAARTPIVDVRAALVTARAEHDAKQEVLNTTHSNVAQRQREGAKAWDDYFAKRNPSAR